MDAIHAGGGSVPENPAVLLPAGYAFATPHVGPGVGTGDSGVGAGLPLAA